MDDSIALRFLLYKDRGAYYGLRGLKRFGGLHMLKTRERRFLYGFKYILETFQGLKARSPPPLFPGDCFWSSGRCQPSKNSKSPLT